MESAIRLRDASTGSVYPTATGASVVLSSSRRSWRSPLIFEVHEMRPQEYEEHVVVGHQLMLNLGSPVRLGWLEGNRRHEQTLPKGGLCIQSNGDANAPRWRDVMTFATAAIPVSMLDNLLQEQGPSATATLFPKRHCVHAPVVHDYARSLARELASPTEPHYSETLCDSLVLHLLQSQAVVRNKAVRLPKGKLAASQLRAAVELVHAELGSNLSLADMARAAGYSSFQFARMFKATTGSAPHQFVLKMRIERACRLLRQPGTTLAQTALLTGFYDQPHLTNVFRKALGVTPAEFVRRS
jgi:AraC family transcriptional regulator